MPDVHDQWLNRPRGLRHLSFAEWLTGDSGVVGGTTKAPDAPSMARTARTRHSTGEMNGLEKRYALHLTTLKAVGEILDWRFEPLKLRLSPATYWTPDFLVQMPDGRIELREVKGHWEDDARVKIKWAAKDYGTLFWITAVTEPRRGEWKTEEFPIRDVMGLLP